MNRTWSKEELKETLIEAKKAYYTGNPVMTDEEYDLLEGMWKFSYPDEPLMVDAGQVSGVFEVPYLSLDKKNCKELRRWLGIGDKEGYPMDKIVVLPKIDGMSMELRFVPNQYGYATLQKAITRGGHDVTKIFDSYCEWFWEEVKIEHPITVRGETFFNKEDLPQLEKIGYTALRNAAAGILNPNRKEVVKGAPSLKFLIWRWVDSPIDNHSGSLRYLADMGLPVAEEREDCVIFNIELMEQDSTIAREFRDAYPYELDGLVIFKNYFKDWEKDSFDDHYYKNAVAWKFEAPAEETVIEDIEWSLGPSGNLTPVAKVKPVVIGGVTVSSVNLHNVENMQKLNVRVGVTAKVRRAGDVIPHIAEVCVGDTDLPDVYVPDFCPRCDAKLHRDGPALMCKEPDCESKIEGVVYKWVDIHEWKFFSEEAMRDMLPYFTSSKDTHPLFLLYVLSEFALNQHMTHGKATRLWKHYQEAFKRTTPATLIASLNIPLVGLKSAEKILEQSNTLINVPVYLKSRRNSGTIYVYEQNLYDWILDNHWTWLKLIGLANNLGLAEQKKEIVQDTKGRVVITGALPGCTREEAFEVIKARGYEPSESLSKGTKFLITENPDSGSTKNQKAMKYGTEVVTWKDFLKLSES